MFLKRKKNRSGSISIVVCEKIKGHYNELTTIGIAHNDEEVEEYVKRGYAWIEREQAKRQPRLDLFGEEQASCKQELEETERILSNISNIYSMAQTIVTIQIHLPKNNETLSKTMLMKRHQKIAKLFDDEFWGTH